MLTFHQVQHDPEIICYIHQADRTLNALGFTEHSLPHAGKCVQTTRWILEQLEYDSRTVELGEISAFLHDIGNMINRSNHAQSGALLAFELLKARGMDFGEIAKIASAIGHHDEPSAFPVDELSSALILADKCDVRSSRVRHFDPFTSDIHDHVNYAVKESHLQMDKNNQTLTLQLTIDTSISTVAQYFEIFLQRMLLCRKAAEYFKYEFKLVINGASLL